MTRVADRTLDQVRRRLQNETLGHRGRKADPLFRSRKLLLRGDERLDERGRDEMMAGVPSAILMTRRSVPGWQGAVRSVYLVDDPAEAAVLLDNAIAACRSDEVADLRILDHTLSREGRDLEPPHTGASNGPTEGSSFCAQQVKRAGRGFTNFDHYRLRVLLHTGGVTWPRPIKPPQLGSVTPH